MSVILEGVLRYPVLFCVSQIPRSAGINCEKRSSFWSSRCVTNEQYIRNNHHQTANFSSRSSSTANEIPRYSYSAARFIPPIALGHLAGDLTPWVSFPIGGLPLPIPKMCTPTPPAKSSL